MQRVLGKIVGNFSAFWDIDKYKNSNEIKQLLEDVARGKYFQAGVHIGNTLRIHMKIS